VAIPGPLAGQKTAMYISPSPEVKKLKCGLLEKLLLGEVMSFLDLGGLYKRSDLEY
jgi:hypothetical protein